MIWLSWRQFRAQAIVAGCALVVLAVVMVITGLSLAHLYATSGVSGCQAHGDCSQRLDYLSGHLRGSVYQAVFYLAILATYAAPALMGAFWGAPLVAHEFETNTFRLAWTQSVSRNRWLIVKVAMIGLAAMIVAALMSWLLSWWTGPVYRAAQYAPPHSSLSFNRISPLLFGVNGIVPIGYAAFAFTAGLTAGVLLKRTIPAMAVTFGGFALVELGWLNLVRAHLFTPVRRNVPLTYSNFDGLNINVANQMTVITGAHQPNAWVLADEAVNAAGHPFSAQATHACLSGSQQACGASILALHVRELIVYQPGSRYWPLQSYETGIFLLAAVALALICLLRISRRRLA
jgi:hypothetical protein